MSTVFISYRRQTASAEARAIFNDLATRLGKNSVFMDVDSIALGRDFRSALQKTLAVCDVMLLIIDKDWLTVKDEKGRVRLENPGDYVRQEIEAALKRDIVLTPVLVAGAQMPAPEELPAEIRDMVYRNAFELTFNRWDSDVNEMIRRLGLTPSERATKIESTGPPATPQADAAATSGAQQAPLAEARGIFSAARSSLEGAFALGAANKKSVGLALLPLVIAIAVYAWMAGFVSPSGPLTSVRLTIVAGQQDSGKPLAAYLKSQGAESSVISASDISNLSLSRPDIVVIALDTVGRWKQNDANHLRQIFENYKVIGVGEAGDELFRELGVPLSGTMGVREDILTVAAPDILKSPIGIDADGGQIEIFKEKVSSRLVGLYDRGSPDIAGFEAVARWQKFPHHWPIARRGNFLFFGYELAVDKMTESSKSLLVNVHIQSQSETVASALADP